MGFPEVNGDRQSRVHIGIPEDISTLETDPVDRGIKSLTRLAGDLWVRNVILAIETSRFLFAQSIENSDHPLAATHIGVAAGMPVALNMPDFFRRGKPAELGNGCLACGIAFASGQRRLAATDYATELTEVAPSDVESVANLPISRESGTAKGLVVDRIKATKPAD